MGGGGGARYTYIPTPKTTVFGVQWPHSNALRGSSVLSYTMVVQSVALTGTCAAYLWEMGDLAVLSVLTMGSLHTKPPAYDFLNLYGACP
jgi:hypothetical protein